MSRFRRSRRYRPNESEVELLTDDVDELLGEVYSLEDRIERVLARSLPMAAELEAKYLRAVRVDARQASAALLALRSHLYGAERWAK
jgi:hypothetical protein